MDSLELHKLMREAGVDQDVIDAACRKNNELVKAEGRLRKHSAPKRVRKEVSRPGEVKVEAQSGRVTLRVDPADQFNPLRCRIRTLPLNAFTLPQLKEFIAALQGIERDMELREVHES